MINSPLSKSRRGFTLVELLVVISIIALLVGFLIPVVSKMRERADSLASINLMRQLGMCMATTASENDSSLPTSWRSGPNGNWYLRLAPKTTDAEFPNSVSMATWEKAFENKIATKTEGFDTKDTSNNATYPRIYSSPYGMNVNLSAVGPGGGIWKLANTTRSSDLVVLGDGTIVGGQAGAGLDYRKTGGNESLSFRHPGKKAALLFADWHITTVTQAEIDKNKGQWFDPTK